jgi:hypothetical protein
VARVSLRDRFFTPPVARAMMSPSGILLAGAGASLGILVGLPIAAVAGLGALAWGARVAAAVPRDADSERIDPFTLNDPWRGFVRDALDAQRRFDKAVRDTRSGPLRDRLQEIADRIDTGVREAWRVARHGQTLADARRTIDVADARNQLDQLGREYPDGVDDGTPVAQTVQALQAQLASAGRMDEVVLDATNRLRLLDARLDEAVARSVELSVQGQDPAQLGGLGTDIDNVVTEMEALRQALDEAGAAPGLPQVARSADAPDPDA